MIISHSKLFLRSHNVLIVSTNKVFETLLNEPLSIAKYSRLADIKKNWC